MSAIVPSQSLQAEPASLVGLIRALLTAAALLTVANSTVAGEAEETALGHEVASNLLGHMGVAYACQSYLGGLGQYQLAKSWTTSIYTRVSGDRNQAILKMDGIDKKIRSEKGNERMEAEFNKMKLSSIDRISTCQEITHESRDEAEVSLAKAGLL